MDTVNRKVHNVLVKRSYHHGDLRTALLASAMTLLDNGGPDAVTVRAVARAAGVAHSAPVNHFPDRAALLTAVANLIFAELIAAVDAALEGQCSPLEKLQAFGPAVIAFAVAHPNRYRLLWRRDSLDPADHGIDAGVTKMCERLKALMLVGGSAADSDVDSEVIALWSMVHGYVTLRLDGNLASGIDTPTGKSRDAAMIDVLVGGLSIGRSLQVGRVNSQT
jgi:AcrR family transcriptional regulator